MEILIPLFLTFLIPIITASAIGRRRLDLTIGKIALRHGVATGSILFVLMFLFVGVASGQIGGGLGAFFLAILAIPTGLLAFGLGAAGGALGAHIGRRK